MWEYVVFSHLIICFTNFSNPDVVRIRLELGTLIYLFHGQRDTNITKQTSHIPRHAFITYMRSSFYMLGWPHDGRHIYSYNDKRLLTRWKMMNIMNFGFTEGNGTFMLAVFILLEYYLIGSEGGIYVLRIVLFRWSEAIIEFTLVFP